MNWAEVFLETFEVSYSTILKMTIIVIPLLIAIECLKDMGWLEKLSVKMRKVTGYIRLPGEAALGLIVAYSVGLVFGSGVIIQLKEETEITRTQLNILFIFIGMCHAIFEETIIFTAVGANGIIVLVSRVLISFIFGFLYVWITKYTDTSIEKSSEKEVV
ncbi:MAG: hypothetical protein VB106_02725 [Clostridiaceae bacterium]|jgi:spore maturation protein SpmB|nr:hypothetical protein [Clostridiaceae bacterium]